MHAEPRASNTRKKKRMQRSACWFGLSVLLGLAAVACSDEGVGDPCTPEAIPVKNGMAGFERTESYIEASSVQCRSRLCIVNKLDNGTNGMIPADPTKICEVSPTPGCITQKQLEDSVHCTCKCGGPKTAEQCDCPDPFFCKEVLTLGGDGIKGSYCVRKE
jgi:hypothetical protein